MTLVIRPFRNDDTEVVVMLWEASGLTRSWNDPRLDIARKATVQPELFLVGTVDDRVVATAMVGYDGHRGWINYLAVDDRVRHRGHARSMMNEAERLLTLRGCPKLNLQVRSTNTAALDFYRALGYSEDHAIGLGKRLIVDGPADPASSPSPQVPPKADMPTHAIHWFEIPVDDFDRAKMFYSRVFDYEMHEMTMDGNRMGRLPSDRATDSVGGAIVEAEDFLPARQGTLVYLNGGDDLAPILLRVDPAGGKVLQEKTLITEDIGYYATFLDSEGNKVALHSPH